MFNILLVSRRKNIFKLLIFLLPLDQQFSSGDKFCLPVPLCPLPGPRGQLAMPRDFSQLRGEGLLLILGE